MSPPRIAFALLFLSSASNQRCLHASRSLPIIVGTTIGGPCDATTGNAFAESLAAGLLATGLLLACKRAATAEDETGFVPIFDGKTLDGWDGDPKLWSVKDGALVGEATTENMPKDDTFCVWRKGTVDDFVLRMQIKISGKGPNSGVQYRSKEFEKWASVVTRPIGIRPAFMSALSTSNRFKTSDGTRWPRRDEGRHRCRWYQRSHQDRQSRRHDRRGF